MPNIITRAFFGLLYVGAIILCSLYSPLSLLILIVLFLGLCLYEVIHLLQFENKLYVIGTVLVTGYLFYTYASKFWLSTGMYGTSFVHLLPALLFLIAIFIIFKSPVELAFDSSKLIFTVVYVGLPFALILSILKRYEIDSFTQLNPFLCLFFLLWCSDSFAYITGRLFGSTPMSSISKNKTVEGLIGGMFFTIVAGIILNYNFPELPGNWIVISIIIAVVAPIGDLAESKLKRIFNVKDSGKLLPGHGGFLDRLDSFLLSSVALYVYFTCLTLIENFEY